MCLDENPDRARERARALSPSTNRRPAREVKRADAPRDESTHLAVKMFANDKHLPVGFRLLAHQKGREITPPRAPFVHPSVPRRSSGREVTLGDAPRDGSLTKKKDVRRDDKRLPGCFRLSARCVDMLREFHLALAGR